MSSANLAQKPPFNKGFWRYFRVVRCERLRQNLHDATNANSIFACKFGNKFPCVPSQGSEYLTP